MICRIGLAVLFFTASSAYSSPHLNSIKEFHENNLFGETIYDGPSNRSWTEIKGYGSNIRKVRQYFANSVLLEKEQWIKISEDGEDTVLTKHFSYDAEDRLVTISTYHGNGPVEAKPESTVIIQRDAIGTLLSIVMKDREQTVGLVTFDHRSKSLTVNKYLEGELRTTLVKTYSLGLPKIRRLRDINDIVTFCPLFQYNPGISEQLYDHGEVVKKVGSVNWKCTSEDSARLRCRGDFSRRIEGSEMTQSVTGVYRKNPLPLWSTYGLKLSLLESEWLPDSMKVTIFHGEQEIKIVTKTTFRADGHINSIHSSDSTHNLRKQFSFEYDSHGAPKMIAQFARDGGPGASWVFQYSN